MTNQSIICINCIFSCDNYEDGLKHYYDTNHKIYKKPDNIKIIKSIKKSILSVNEDNHKPLICKECNYECINRAESYIHSYETNHFSFYILENKNNKDNKSCQICLDCNLEFEDSYETVIHTIKTNHNNFINKKYYDSIKIKDNLPIICESCELEFKNRFESLIHTKNTLHYKFKLKYDLNYQQVNILNEILKSTNKIDKELRICNKCNIEFKNLFEFQLHKFETNHNNYYIIINNDNIFNDNELFKCLKCNIELNNFDNLVNHILDHESQILSLNPLNYLSLECLECNLQFKNRNQSLIHSIICNHKKFKIIDTKKINLIKYFKINPRTFLINHQICRHCDFIPQNEIDVIIHRNDSSHNRFINIKQINLPSICTICNYKCFNLNHEIKHEKITNHSNFKMCDINYIDKDCCICYEKLIDNVKLPFKNCFHSFHENCITRWLNHNNNCPICREI